jgi:HAD superfamily hydrolase (TIGR01509 family)
MSRIRAVILDLDGLMVDSEPLSYKAWQVLLGEYGYSFMEDQYRHLIGIDGDASVAYLRRTMELPLSNQEILDRHYQLWIEIMRKEARPMEGLKVLIEDMKSRKLKIGVASNSHTEHVHNTLEIIGLDGDLSCVSTVDMVRQGKPAPDVYLRTAECLGVVPEVCLALEDSPTGLQSAINAGIRCAVVPNKALFDATYEGAFAIFPTLLELTTNLDWLLS